MWSSSGQLRPQATGRWWSGHLPRHPSRRRQRTKRPMRQALTSTRLQPSCNGNRRRRGFGSSVSQRETPRPSRLVPAPTVSRSGVSRTSNGSPLSASCGISRRRTRSRMVRRPVIRSSAPRPPPPHQVRPKPSSRHRLWRRSPPTGSSTTPPISGFAPAFRRISGRRHTDFQRTAPTSRSSCAMCGLPPITALRRGRGGLSATSQVAPLSAALAQSSERCTPETFKASSTPTPMPAAVP